VLCLENFKSPAAFTYETQALVVSLTQQTALNLENSRLYRAANQRASQLQALTGVAAIITKNLRPDELIEPLLDQLYAFLPFNTGTLWLRQGDNMIVRVARGFVDSDERKGLTVAIEDSALLKEMIATGQPIAVGDVNLDQRFSSLVENPNHSWLGLPLIASGEVIGVIALEMSEANFYTSEYVQLASTFASQAAVALENANLYQQSVDRAAELDQRSQRLEMLNRFSKSLSQSLDPAELIQITMEEIRHTTHCSAVSVILFTPEGQAILQAQMPEQAGDMPDVLPAIPLFERLQQTLGVFNTEDVFAEDELTPLRDFLEGMETKSMLALSLATGNDLHGVILAHTSHPYRFSADEIGLAKTIGNQAALAIQNARLYAETRSLSAALDQRVKERTEQLARAHQRTEILLKLITELSASLDLDQVLTRTLKVLNNIIDAEHITVLIARSGEKKLHHLASVGYETPITTQEFYTSLDTDQGLAGWIINQMKPVLIPDIRVDPRWIDLPNQTTRYHSAVGVPLMIGGEALGALLFYHRSLDHFSIDQLDLVQAAANQVAIAVNNAELYRLIRDQAEDLGNLVRSQQIETQRTKAILEDVADGVLVTDETMKITLLNDSGQNILSLNREQVVGKSLEHFTGLFGRAALSWMDTIRKWSQNPEDTRSGDTFAEQINLEGDRVVSVHLAPVSLRDVFLGTVSIFRDITHQVEVDRLKSEFVATVSHELRTPMTSIKGYVDILLMGAAGDLTEQQVHFLEIVKNNTDRLGVLVNDLLDISRIESGRLTLALQTLDLGYIMEQAANSLRQRSQDEHKPMRIETDIPRKLPRVDGDPEQVRRIIDNLLENAYYYSEQDGQIFVRLQQYDTEVHVEIQDSGIGIPKDQQPRVFERFYRGEHPFVLATSGTGLGLSIVQHLVEMHHGRIWVQSSGVPGEGSVFTFTLPIHQSDGM
jgi:PAS domain S-box-containing protein